MREITDVGYLLSEMSETNSLLILSWSPQGESMVPTPGCDVPWHAVDAGK